MSDLIVIQDSRLPKAHQYKSTVKGPKTLFWNSLAANSNTSIQSSTFNINMPSRKAGLSRNLYRHITGNIVLTSTGTGASSLSAAVGATATCQWIFSLNSLALSQDTLSTTTSLSNSGVTLSVSNINYLADEISYYKHNSKLDSTLYSSTTSFKNRFNNFLDSQDSNSIFTSTSNHYTSDSSPFPNTSKITGITYTASGAAGSLLISNVTISFDIYEPLVSGLFMTDDELDKEYLYGMDTISITTTCSQNVNNFLKMTIPGNPYATSTNITTTLNILSNDLHYAIVMPESDSIIPKTMFYTNKNFITSINSCVTKPSQNTPVTNITISSPVITLSTLPSYFIFSIETANQSITQPKAYCPIRSISINFGSYSGLFNNCTGKQLYQIAYNSGLRQPFDVFNSQSAGVIGTQSVTATYALGQTKGAVNYLNSCPLAISISDLNNDGQLMGELNSSSSIPFQAVISYDHCIPSIYAANTGFDGFGVTPLNLVITCVYEEVLQVDTDSGNASLKAAYFTKSELKDAKMIAKKHVGSGFTDFLGTMLDTLSLDVPSLIKRVKGDKKGLGYQKCDDEDIEDQKTSIGSGILKRDSLKRSIWN